MSSDVFVSHSSKDKQVADAVTAALEQQKFRCWLAPRDILPGDSWGGAIIKAIERCKVMVVIFSEHSNASKQVMREVERAVQKDVVIIPFRIDDIKPTEDMEYFLSSTHWLDAVSPKMDKHIENLTATVGSILGMQSQAVLNSPVLEASNRSTMTQKKSANKRKMQISFGLSLFLLASILAGGAWYLSSKPVHNKSVDVPNKIAKEKDKAITLLPEGPFLAGRKIDVNWQGETSKGDRIATTKEQTDQPVYLSNVPISTGPPVKVDLPETAGTYRLLYLSGKAETIIAEKLITVLSADIALHVPRTASTGQIVEIEIMGAVNKNDIVGVANPDAKIDEFIFSGLVRPGRALKLRMPDLPGDYEFRFVSRKKQQISLRYPVTIAEVSASISTNQEAMAGSNVLVEWTGPANSRDHLCLVKAEEPNSKCVSRAGIKVGKKLNLRMPDIMGNYLLRYVSGGEGSIWAEVKIQISDRKEVLAAPSQVKPGESFTLNWKEKGNSGEFVSIAHPSAKPEKVITKVAARGKDHAKFKAPDEPGTYELRYVSGQSRFIWGTRQIVVQSGN